MRGDTVRITTWTLGFISAWACFYGFYWALGTVLVPFVFEMREAWALRRQERERWVFEHGRWRDLSNPYDARR